MRYLLLTLLAGSLFATDPTPTDNYLALTATLLEHRIINDDHLLRMIDSAEQGKAVNPISPSETKIDSQKLIASQAYNNVLKDDIDTSRITPWAKERLSQEAKEREEKKDKQRESKSLAKPSKNQLIGQTHLNTCHLDLTGQLQCSEKKIPNLKGKTLALMDGSLLLITQEQNLVKIDLINGDVQTFSEKHRGNLQDLAWHNTRIMQEMAIFNR
ncbi:MAG: hypothetical protein JKY15_04855 [Deltaproteobacteria bacterium]|nr:hypothetical protein [Deltaproteobacteria bacterium]